jgi:exodeoxyribonuclease V alpha subunit
MNDAPSTPLLALELLCNHLPAELQIDKAQKQVMESILSKESASLYGYKLSLAEQSIVEHSMWFGKESAHPLFIQDLQGCWYSGKIWDAMVFLQKVLVPRPTGVQAQGFQSKPRSTGVQESTLKQIESDSKQIELSPEQHHAVQNALQHTLCIISGGPGTGKTTVIRSALRKVVYTGGNYPVHKVIFCAPTGKALARMQESIKDEEFKSTEKPLFYTLHRLLGVAPGKPMGRPHPDLLQASLVVLDEASMVSVHMLYWLLKLLPATCRLWLVGDSRQLPPLEMGIFGEFFNPQSMLYPTVQSCTTMLCTMQRSTGEVADLVDALSSSKVAKVKELFINSSKVSFHAMEGLPNYLAEKLQSGPWNARGEAEFKTLCNQWQKSWKALCFYTQKRPGTDWVHQVIRRVLRVGGGLYQGMPVMVRQNVAELNLWNGDVGWLWLAQGEPMVYFPDSSHSLVPLTALTQWEEAWALTVHKAQGSEWEEVVVVLPSQTDWELKDKLFYTALSRARTKLVVFASGSFDEFLDCYVA